VTSHSQVEIFVVTGPMASGKTTVAAALASSFPRGVHLEGDVYRRFIVSGRREMSPNADNEATAQLRLRYELTANAALAYAHHGFTVVVEDVIAGDSLPAFVSLVTWRPLRVTVLLPNPRVLAQREAARGARGYDDWTPRQLHNVFAKETPQIGLWLDTSDQRPGETVATILSRPAEALIP